MTYITTKQAAGKWGISPRRVQVLCKEGKIEGAEQHGREWLIPNSSPKPVDRRVEKAPAYSQSNQNTAKDIVFFSERYKQSGSASQIQKSLADNKLHLDFFNMQYFYYKGQIRKAYEFAQKYIKEPLSFANRTLLGYHMTLVSVAEGNIKSWYAAQDYLRSSEAQGKKFDVVDFILAANASSVYDGSLFPDWFRRGDFTHLPPKMYAQARLYYVKYLYIMTHDEACIQHNIPKIEFIRILPLIIEPLISQAVSEGNLINESYLRLMCAACYHVGGEDSLATNHVKQAVDILLPDKLYLPLAEYRHRVGNLLDNYIGEIDEQALSEIKRLSKKVHQGWITIHNEVTKRNVCDTLSLRERQISKLAIYGLSNKEIADRYGISVNAVKQALRTTMDKTGAKTRAELHNFV